MAKKLPFVVEPKRTLPPYTVGNEESGTFLIERRGYLTVAEKAFFQGAQVSDNTVTAMHSLVREICVATKMPHEKVFSLMTDLEAPELEPWRDRVYQVVMEMQNFQARQAIIAATALLMSRFDSEWTVNDTMELHPDIVSDLHSLFQLEDARSMADITSDQTEEEAVRADEGKEPAKETQDKA